MSDASIKNNIVKLIDDFVTVVQNPWSQCLVE